MCRKLKSQLSIIYAFKACSFCHFYDIRKMCYRKKKKALYSNVVSRKEKAKVDKTSKIKDFSNIILT